MARTNIEIDGELIARVMQRNDFRSKREAVDAALRSLDVDPLSREQVLELEGSGWEGDLDQMRSTPAPLDAWVGRD